MASFYEGYSKRRDANEQVGMRDLAQASSLVQIQQAMMAQRNAAQDQQRNEAMMAEIAAIPPEQRNRTTVLPIVMKHSRNAKDLVAALPEATKAQPIGAGGLRLEDGTVVPPAARPEAPVKATPTKLAQLTAERDALPPGHPNRRAYDAAIAKETERAPHSYPVIQTPQGVFERTPQGLVRLNVPGTTTPLTQTPPKATEPGQTPENAGKISMARQAVDGIGTVRGIIFDKDGNLNRGLIGAMNLPIVSGLPGNSQARIARSAIRNAVEAKLRIETGAAATESEVERTLARFLPTVGDTKESATFKLNELEKFFKTSLSLTKGADTPKADDNDPLGIRKP